MTKDASDRRWIWRSPKPSKLASSNQSGSCTERYLEAPAPGPPHSSGILPPLTVVLRGGVETPAFKRSQSWNSSGFSMIHGEDSLKGVLLDGSCRS